MSLRSGGAATLSSAIVVLAGHCLAQEGVPAAGLGYSAETYQLGHSPLNEPAALAKQEQPTPQRFFLPVGLGGFNVNLGLKGEYVDNVYLADQGASDDFILIPEAEVAGFFPVGQHNFLAVDVALAYYQYLRHSSLNTGAPVINPNSDLAFNLRAGDFRFRFSEGFSYEQTPIYETGSEFYNLYDTALFQRYLNRVGVLGTWDQHDLVLTAGYYHENLWSGTSHYNYIDHASELFSADAVLSVAPRIKAGLEAAGSIHDFFNSSSYDTWRARMGPTFRMNPSEFLQFRLGGGFERIEFDSAGGSTLRPRPQNTYYAYADVQHQWNQFLSHSLTLSHDNQLGFNAANLEGSTVSYTLTWSPRRHLRISPLVSISYYEESFGSSRANLYHETFMYYRFGFTARYDLGPHWQAGARWDYRLKDSDIDLAEYGQNLVSLEVLYRF